MQKDVTGTHTSSDTATGSADDVDHASNSSGSHWKRHCSETISFCCQTRKHCRCTVQQRRITVGLILMSAAGVAFVAVTTSLVSSTASYQFNAPLFTVNVATFPTIFLYPLHITYRYLLQRGKLSVRDAFRWPFFYCRLQVKHLKIERLDCRFSLLRKRTVYHYCFSTLLLLVTK